MTSVDVIILSWDRLTDTIDAIKSALVQENVDLKIFVVDQGSKPENILKIREFCTTDPRITLICNAINTGVPGGRNQASFAGHGQYIVSLDNDAVFESVTDLFSVTLIMNSSPSIGILAFRIKCFDKNKDDLSSWPYSTKPKPEEFESEFKTTRFVGAGHAIRRDVFEKVRGYDTRLFFMHEEIDLAKRFINAGYDIVYNPTPVVRHKVSSEHRVNWSGKRFYYDVRNRTYLHFKHGTFFPTILFHTFLILLKGVMLGHGLAAFKGLLASFPLLPFAISQRFKDPYVVETEKSKAYLHDCNHLVGYNVWQRICFRLGHIVS